MYKADGKHMRVRVERGEGLIDTTMAEYHGYLKRYIVKQWGSRILSSLLANTTYMLYIFIVTGK